MSLLNPQKGGGVSCYAPMMVAFHDLKAAMTAAEENTPDRVLRLLDEAEAQIRVARAKVHEAMAAEFMERKREVPSK